MGFSSRAPSLHSSATSEHRRRPPKRKPATRRIPLCTISSSHRLISQLQLGTIKRPPWPHHRAEGPCITGQTSMRPSITRTLVTIAYLVPMSALTVALIVGVIIRADLHGDQPVGAATTIGRWTTQTEVGSFASSGTRSEDIYRNWDVNHGYGVKAPPEIIKITRTFGFPIRCLKYHLVGSRDGAFISSGLPKSGVVTHPSDFARVRIFPVDIEWPRLLLCVVVWVGVYFVSITGFRFGRIALRRRRHLCEVCCYPMRSQTGVCPECGQTTRRDHR